MADYEDTKVTDLVINNISQEKFDELKAAGELDPTQIYLTPTEESGGGGASLPDQTGNKGKFLTTDGTTASWGEALKNNSSNIYAMAIGQSSDADIGGTAVGNSSKVFGYYGTAIGALAKILNSGSGNGGISIGYCAEANKGTILLNASGEAQQNRVDGTFVVATSAGTFTVTDANGNVPRERLKNLVEVLPTAENGYTTVKNYGNGYVEITGYTAIGSVGASTGSEVQIDLPAGYTMANANYWVNIAPTSETTMFDFKAEAKARSTTHFMVAYKNEDTQTALTAAGVYWEVRGMLATE